MNQSHQAYVCIRDLQFAYRNRLIFDGLNLDIPQGKITAIMGPSGTGKTTLLRLIGGQLYPDNGRILVRGTDIHQLSRDRLLLERREMGLLFQSGALFTNFNVYENVAFPLREHTEFSEDMIRTLVLMKLEIVGLRGARHLMANELSGGMVRRVALARALALDPQLMMYDEPFTGLDPISLGVIVKLIKEINQTLGLTSIIVTHDVAEVLSIADYIYILSGGQLIGAGAPDQLAQDKNPAVKQFMQGLPDGVVPFHYPCATFFEDLYSND